MSVNKVILLGRVGKDPEVRYLNQEQTTKVARIALATSKRWTDRDGQKREVTEWHNIVAWRQLADVVEKFVKKGQQLFVEGELATRQYETAAGQKNRTTEILASRIELLGSPEKPEQPEHPKPVTPYQQFEAAPAPANQDLFANNQDDLPF